MSSWYAWRGRTRQVARNLTDMWDGFLLGKHHTIQTSRENVFHRAIAVRAQSFRSCASGLETLTAPAAA